MEDWEGMVSRAEAPASLADETSATGAPFGVASGYSTTGAEAAAPVNVAAVVSAGLSLAATAYEGGKAEVASVLDAAGERAAKVGASLKWWALGAVVLVAGVAAIIYAPTVKAGAKLAGVG